MNSRLIEMIARGRLPFRGGQWIDTYNQITNPDCAGTIIAGVNAKNLYYVMEEMKHDIDTEDNVQVVGTIHPGQNGTIYNTDGVAPTICAGEGVKCNTKIAEPIVLGLTRDEKGKVVDRHPVEVANAVTAAKRDNTQNYVLEEIIKDVRRRYPNRGIFLHDGKIYFIRKLTPRECFRLMGMSDADIDKIQAAGISKSQQYKMAGNSICVPTLTAILRQLFIGNFNKVVQTEIF